MSQGSAYGIPIDTDGTLSANSDQLVPSQKAIKTYVDTEIAGLPTPVESVTDDGNGVVTVDNTDPANPVIGYNGGAAGDGGNVISAGGVTAASTGTVVFSNANSVSFGMAGNTVTASFSAPSGGNLSFSAGTQSSTVNALTFSNSNGVSFGLNNGTVTASHNGLTVQSVQTQNMVSVLGSTGDISFANSNGITFGGNASTITAKHNGITSQSVQPVAVSGSNGSFSFSTVTFGNLNGISFYTSNNSLVGSYTVPTVTNSSLTASAGTQSATVSQLVFSNSNGVSFGLDNGTITGSHNGLTSQSNQAISGSNGSFTFQTVTFGNLNGMSFYTSNGSLVASYTVPAAGGALSFSAGTTSNTLNSLVFSNLNGVSFGLNGSTVTASVNAGGGSDITLSMWPDRLNAPSMLGTQYSGSTGNTGGSTQQTASYFVASIQLQHPVVFDNVFGNIVVSATSAGTGSATAGHCIGLYSLDANTALSLVSSWQWQMYVSQNSVTARSHKWFWGTDPTANSSGLSGNVSASFTSPSNAGRRFLMSNGLNTLTEGNYYLVSAYTARSAGANVYNAGTQAALDGIGAAVAATMVGEANISRLVGFNGLFSSTTNVSTLGVAIMPSSIHTSAITVSATNASGTHRTPFIIFERSQS